MKSKQKVVDEALTPNKTPIPLHIGQIAGRGKHHPGKRTYLSSKDAHGRLQKKKKKKNFESRSLFLLFSSVESQFYEKDLLMMLYLRISCLAVHKLEIILKGKETGQVSSQLSQRSAGIQRRPGFEPASLEEH